MDRLSLFESLQRIKGSVAVAEWFLANEDDDVTVAVELLGRSSIIESKVAELRGRLDQPGKGERPGLHVLGHRPPTDAA